MEAERGGAASPPAEPAGLGPLQGPPQAPAAACCRAGAAPASLHDLALRLRERPWAPRRTAGGEKGAPLPTTPAGTAAAGLQAPSLLRRLRRAAELEGHRGCVNSICYSANGALIITGSDDCQVGLWCAETHRRLALLPTLHTHNIFHASAVPHTGNARLLTLAADGEVRLMDVPSSPGLRARADAEGSPGRGGFARAVAGGHAAAPVGSQLLGSHAGSMMLSAAFLPLMPACFLATCQDGRVRLYDIRVPRAGGSGGPARRLPRPFLRLRAGDGGDAPDGADGGGGIPVVDLSACGAASDVAFDPLRPHVFAVGCDDPWVRLYDLRMPSYRPEAGAGAPALSAPPGRCLRRLAPPELSVCGRSRGGGVRPPRAMSDGVSGIDFSPSGELVATYRGASVYLFDSDTVRGAARGAERPYSPRMLAREAEENRAGEPALDGAMHAAAAARYRGAQNERTFLKQVRFVAGGSHIATGSDSGHVYIWQKASGALVRRLRGDGSVVNAIAPHPSLPYIACSGIDDSAKVFRPGPDLAPLAAQAERRGGGGEDGPAPAGRGRAQRDASAERAVSLGREELRQALLAVAGLGGEIRMGLDGTLEVGLPPAAAPRSGARAGRAGAAGPSSGAAAGAGAEAGAVADSDDEEESGGSEEEEEEEGEEEDDEDDAMRRALVLRLFGGGRPAAAGAGAGAAAAPLVRETSDGSGSDGEGGGGGGGFDRHDSEEDDDDADVWPPEWWQRLRRGRHGRDGSEEEEEEESGSDESGGESSSESGSEGGEEDGEDDDSGGDEGPSEGESDDSDDEEGPGGGAGHKSGGDGSDDDRGGSDGAGSGPAGPSGHGRPDGGGNGESGGPAGGSSATQEDRRDRIVNLLLSRVRPGRGGRARAVAPAAALAAALKALPAKGAGKGWAALSQLPDPARGGPILRVMVMAAVGSARSAPGENVGGTPPPSPPVEAKGEEGMGPEEASTEGNEGGDSEDEEALEWELERLVSRRTAAAESLAADVLGAAPSVAGRVAAFDTRAAGLAAALAAVAPAGAGPPAAEGWRAVGQHAGDPEAAAARRAATAAWALEEAEREALSWGRSAQRPRRAARGLPGGGGSGGAEDNEGNGDEDEDEDADDDDEQGGGGAFGDGDEDEELEGFGDGDEPGRRLGRRDRLGRRGGPGVLLIPGEDDDALAACGASGGGGLGASPGGAAGGATCRPLDAEPEEDEVDRIAAGREAGWREADRRPPKGAIAYDPHGEEPEGGEELAPRSRAAAAAPAGTVAARALAPAGAVVPLRGAPPPARRPDRTLYVPGRRPAAPDGPPGGMPDGAEPAGSRSEAGAAGTADTLAAAGRRGRRVRFDVPAGRADDSRGAPSPPGCRPLLPSRRTSRVPDYVLRPDKYVRVELDGPDYDNSAALADALAAARAARAAADAGGGSGIDDAAGPGARPVFRPKRPAAEPAAAEPAAPRPERVRAAAVSRDEDEERGSDEEPAGTGLPAALPVGEMPPPRKRQYRGRDKE